MSSVLQTYLPAKAVTSVEELLKTYSVHLKIVNERQSKHGDYRPMPDGRHQITINANLNPYRFLITLIHEIAHLLVFINYGQHTKPHGRVWKLTFQKLMLPLINPQIFPEKLLPLIAKHFKNPRASSDTDSQLSIALKAYDQPTDKNYIFEIPEGTQFCLPNGKIFIKEEKLRKRYKCRELSTGKHYVFQPNAQVEVLK
ncbi:SprT-like domain-containing protein [Mesohalobacter halotolerans]|uniref:SprT family zinc-dependent metalloprotease n=1 Tax=Mesohalobacter halotolerans TaxID=1883405 RepID=A0A4V6ANV0_9FLAO|nr:SprT-like domain-containing protein [Mesohalobacter halotolerans]MBS3738551.1 SprT-like domain-containing protein [Psychroflexus sp.]TKS56245.1 SprT family zinc-dependent metalloprotease [Mesohalobacter halotolerans]